MDNTKRLLDILVAISSISNDMKLGYPEKLQAILLQIIQALDSERGSIMLLKGKKNLEVVASSNKELIGIKQALDENTPSAWVVKNNSLLYVDAVKSHPPFKQKFDHYQKKAFLLAPIMRTNKVIGVISITEKNKEDNFPKDDQEILLKLIGHIISAIESLRLSESLKTSKKQLRIKNERLKKLEKIRTELFNMLVHDLKGPISDVIANIDILYYTVDNENLEYVEAAQMGCDRLYRMVLDLLNIARFEDGSMSLVLEKIKPSELIDESKMRLQGIADMKKIQILEELPDIKNQPILAGDRELLSRVLQNLLINAIHYSPDGGQIEIGFGEGHNQKIEFFIKDYGPGVPQEFHKTIFDKFFQVEEKNDGRRFTSGLGLTFCKMAVEAHEGDIFVESDGKSGSTFRVFLPYCPVKGVKLSTL